MALISTVIGELNLWYDKDIELVEINVDRSKRKLMLTFTTRDIEGSNKSTDKLKIYGVKDFDENVLTMNLIKGAINLIDLRLKKEVKLLDSQGTLLQTITCDKFVFDQKKHS
jgi:hypothetical protein